jgi:hypothetical protein
VDLQSSLAISQAVVETSGKKLELLQTDLNVSTAYTTQVDLDIAQAQKHARELEFQNGLLKIGGTVLLVGSADLAVKAFTGKDAVEWLITLVRGK